MTQPTQTNQEQIDSVISSLESKIRHLFHSEASGHDLYHLKRVLNLALTIQEQEGGDRMAVAIAAFLHDLHRIMEKETGAFCPPKDSLPQVRKLFKDIETLILQDADNLDAIGAIGIGRTFSFCGAHGIVMWNPEIPFGREHFDESGLDPSTMHHFHNKLLRLRENMNTETGKRMAQHRHDVMERFVTEFMSEWEGKM